MLVPSSRPLVNVALLYGISVFTRCEAHVFAAHSSCWRCVVLLRTSTDIMTIDEELVFVPLPLQHL
eukprot:6420204-Amphidinium_carterae.1